jgi:hypothetical protein
MRRTPGQTAARRKKEMQFKVSEHLRKTFALVVVAGFVALALSMSPGAASASSPFSGELHVTKECSEYNYQAGGFCTITSSNIKAIEVGSRVVYASAFGDPAPGFLDSDITLVVGPGNTALGHVVVEGSTGTGPGTLSGGTGKFNHLNASFAISVDSTGVWHWDGTYSFSPPN